MRQTSFGPGPERGIFRAPDRAFRMAGTDDLPFCRQRHRSGHRPGSVGWGRLSSGPCDIATNRVSAVSFRAWRRSC